MAVADLPERPEIIPSIKQAWTNIWPHFWWLLLFGLFAGIANGIEAGNQAGPEDRVFINGVGGLVALFIGAPLSFGVWKAHLAASRGEKPTWQDLGFAFGPRYWSTVGTYLLVMLSILAGLILLVIPGIYIAVRLVFTIPHFIEDDLELTAALKASWADTEGRWWSVFGLALMSIPLIIAGALALGVGVFVAMVLIPQMFAVYWRSVQAQSATA